MTEGNITFGNEEGLYPGRVIRVGPTIDWAVLRDLSYERERLSAAKYQNSTPTSSPNASHSTSTVAENNAPANVTDEDIERSPRMEAAPRKDSRSEAHSGSVGLPATLTVLEKLEGLLLEPAINLDAVKKVAWAGLPSAIRAPIWKILLGYVPTSMARRSDTLQRRRREYREAVEQHYSPISLEEDSSIDRTTHAYNRAGNQEDVTRRQIAVDIPRTCPRHALFHIPEVQLALERILYVWATRHPASGYVQGMNDLVTPFVFVFLSEYTIVSGEKSILGLSDMSAFRDAEESLANAEADAYWCLTALLNDIQDYYTFSQPGIQRRVHYLRELVARVDNDLCSHLEEEGLDFLQFAFRWMNCLLMRELPFPLIVRVWDTYLAEADGFALFHVYVCAALLVSFSEELQEMDFQDLVMFLQNLPTQLWTSKEIDVILSQAYMWRTIFGAAPSHLHLQ